MAHLVLIGDIIGSKKIPGRENFQRAFQKNVQRINNEYRNLFLSPLTVTLGDEFQGVLKNADTMFLLMHSLQVTLSKQLQGFALRFSIGYGGIDTDINPENAIGMDGSAFHFAREGIELSKQQERWYYFKSELPENEIINDLLNFVDITIKTWNTKRIEILYHYRRGLNQKQICNLVGISQSAVSQNLNQSETQAVLRAEHSLENYLNRVLKK
jgi:hypothetical protein